MSARIALCGRLEIELGGERIEARLPGRQGPLVLALLVLNRSRPVARDELIGALWPGRPPADPDEALSALLSKVRHVLGRDVLTGRRELTLVLPEDAEIDVERAFTEAERAQAALAAGDAAAAWDAASATLEITGRGFLVGLDAPWVDERRGELDEVRLRALEAAARAGVALGGARVSGAEQAARELTRAAPLREAGHRLLMEALAARGEIAEALAAYEDLRVLLRDELGTAPGELVRALHERLLTREPARTAPKRVPLPALLARERGELVGRDPELARVRAAWADACAGSRRMVVLCGGPGIGKTRLSGELAREAQADGTVLYAACQEDSLVSYQPFVEALRQYVRTGSLDGALGAGAAELTRLIPELPLPAVRADEPDDPQTRRYLLFEAVSALLTHACERSPVLLLLDDLHWADRSTLQLLGHVVRAPHDTALLIVGTYRELEITTDHPLSELLADLRRDRLFERVSLDGLDRPSVRALIADRAGQDAPPALVETVHVGTEGNPFFVEEVVRHLIETGRWSPTLTPDEIGVPEGVKEVLARRLARLSETCRGVLSQAAVLGRAFEFGLLTDMAGTDESTVMGALEEALGARLVEEQGDDFAFTHALVRETLYGALSAPRRQRMHALAARAIEAGDAQIDALAAHYRLAGPAGDPAKAIEYSLRAGEGARQLFAWDEAAAHWDGALRLMERGGTDPVGRARLHVALTDVYAVVGDLARQIDQLERALALYTELGDEERSAQAHSRLGMAHSLIDSIYADHLDIKRAFGHFEAARAVLHRGPVRRAQGHLDKTTYKQEIADCIGRCHVLRGEMTRARELLSGARPAWATHALEPLVDLWEGRWDKVEALAGRVLETSRRTGNRWDEQAAHHLRARVLYLRGAPERAAELLERSRTIVQDGGAGFFELWVLPDLARARADTGRLDEARAHVARCREILAAGEDWRGRRGIAEVAEAVVLSFEHRPGEAGARFASALRTLRDFKLVGDQADGLHQWGLALDRAGDRSGAAEKLSAAAELFRAHGAGVAWLRRLDGR